MEDLLVLGSLADNNVVSALMAATELNYTSCEGLQITEDLFSRPLSPEVWERWCDLWAVIWKE